MKPFTVALFVLFALIPQVAQCHIEDPSVESLSGLRQTSAGVGVTGVTGTPSRTFLTLDQINHFDRDTGQEIKEKLQTILTVHAEGGQRPQDHQAEFSVSILLISVNGRTNEYTFSAHCVLGQQVSITRNGMLMYATTYERDAYGTATNVKQLHDVVISLTNQFIKDYSTANAVASVSGVKLRSVSSYLPSTERKIARRR